MNASVGLDLLHTFRVVAEELNFRRSAVRLNLDQSALSRRIQKLESGLGFKLLERTTREVALTQAGQSFYRDGTLLLNRYEETIEGARRIAEGKVGHLRIAYNSFAATKLVPSAVKRFRQAHPHVDLSLHYIPTQGQKRMLANDEVDVGFMIGPFEHPDYSSHLLSTEVLYVVTPLNHPLSRKRHVTPTDLAHQDLILGDMQEWGEYRRRLSDLVSTEGIRLNVKIEASSTLALIGLVAAGLGITIYPESMIASCGPLVEVRPIVHSQFYSRTVLAWKRFNRSEHVRVFVEVAISLTSERESRPGGATFSARNLTV
jgi:DNA-binding transcriptional LysR family regulator